MYRVVPSSVSSPHAQVIRRSYETGSRDTLSRHQYPALWIFMVLLHALCSAFLICSAKLYWLMENEHLDYFAGLLAPERDRHFRVVGTMFSVLGQSTGCNCSVTSELPKCSPLNLGLAIEAFLKLVVSKLTRLGYRWEYCGDRNASPERISVQHTSRAVLDKSREGVADSGKLLVAFIIHQILLKSVLVPSRSPFTNKTCTTVLLATGTAIVLPSAIILPYALEFDFVDLNFPAAMLYGDTSFPNLVLENRAFFFMSWANAAMKIVPHLSLFLCWKGLRPCSILHVYLTQPQRQLRRFRNLLLSGPASSDLSSHQHRFVRSCDTIFVSSASCDDPNALIDYWRPRTWLASFGTVWSCIGDMQNGELCMQRMHPWFTSNFSCAVVRYNCYKEGVTSPSAEVLGWLERGAVRKISSYGTQHLWNGGKKLLCRLNASYDALYALCVCESDGIPPGILQPPLPEQLTDLEFIHTNLTMIPESVVEPWNALAYRQQDWTVPDDAFLNGVSSYFYNLACQESMRELPQARSTNFDVSYLALEFTLLTEVPAWIKANVWDAVSLGGSPLCHSRNLIVELAENVLCGEDENAWDPLGDERYPTKLIKPFRSLNA
ncbi:hypothetical protein GQ600_22718 [Phytophthora cactorum]|nr:hypothetical protein GQ600_22718 [Phytophthora cactorum]